MSEGFYFIYYYLFYGLDAISSLGKVVFGFFILFLILFLFLILIFSKLN